MNDTLKNRIEAEALRTADRYNPHTSQYSSGKHFGHIRGFAEGAKYALAHQWIGVDEALPDYNVSVLVADNEGSIYFNHRSNRPEVDTFANGFCRLLGIPGEIVAWMLIPEMQKGEQQ